MSGTNVRVGQIVVHVARPRHCSCFVRVFAHYKLTFTSHAHVVVAFLVQATQHGNEREKVMVLTLHNVVSDKNGLYSACRKNNGLFLYSANPRTMPHNS